MKASNLSEDPNQKIYRQINLVAEESKATVYFVGGCVRNLILHQPILDIDLLVYGTDLFLSLLHKRIPSALICLDKGREIYRLVIRKSRITIDITLEKNSERLCQNLSERDFTINAMAIKSVDILDLKTSIIDRLIDPFNGRQDGEKGIIRMVSKENFIHDPLRLCRAFRFGAEFGFSIYPKTLETISENAPLINNIAPERIHEEWIKTIQSSRAAIYIKKMKESGLLEQIFPEIISMEGVDQGERHALTLWEHSWMTLFYLEKILETPDKYLNPKLKGMINNFKSDYTNQLPYLKMAALFHDLGKPNVKAIGKKGRITFYGHQQIGATILGSRMATLRFSKAEIRLTTKLVQDHMRPLLLSLTKKVSEKAMVKFFIHAGETWQALLLLSISDILSTNFNKQKIDIYMNFLNSLFLFREKMEKLSQKGPLITGKDLKKTLLFPPGPLMGKVLSMINQSFLCGTIKTKADALELAQKFLNSKKNENSCK